LYQSLIKGFFYPAAGLVKIDKTMTGKHQVRIETGKTLQRLKVHRIIKINGTVPAEISVQQGTDYISAYGYKPAFMPERINGAARSVSRKVHYADLQAQNIQGLAVFTRLYFVTGGKSTMVKIPATAFVPGSDGFRGFGVGDKPDSAGIQTIRRPGMIQMGMG
jgi:hypothetical protein